MKITIVTGFFLPVPPVAGGAMEKIWWRLAGEFAGRGHDVTLLSRCWPGWPDDDVRDGVRFIRIPGHAHRRRLAANLVLDAWWGLRVQRRLPPADILVTNTVALPVWVARRRPEAGRLVVNLNRFPKGQLRWYGRVARVQAASAAIAAAAARQAPGLRDCIRITPNPIDWQVFAAAAARRSRPARPVRIGYHGRIHPEKGLLELVQAAVRMLDHPHLPEWHLSLRGPVDVAQGGGGPGYAELLRRNAEPLRARGRFELLPPEFDPERLATACADLDVFCYPSRAETGEALPVAVLEAMAAARPVVVTDLECFREYVQDGVSGVVHAGWKRPDATERLAARLAELVSEPDRRDQLGATAQRRVERLGFPSVAEAMLADFAQLHDAQP